MECLRASCSSLPRTWAALWSEVAIKIYQMEASQLDGSGNQFQPFTKDWDAAMERKACVSSKNRNVISILLHFSMQSCACEPFLSTLALPEMHYHIQELQSEATMHFLFFFYYQNHVYRNSQLNVYYQTITTYAFVFIAVHSAY